MIKQIILTWAEKYLEKDVFEEYRTKCDIELCDELLFELADRRIYDKATVLLNSTVSNRGIIEALYAALAMWSEHRADSHFIDSCLRKLGIINRQNCPAFLTHILIGGAYPYLLPALKLGFQWDTIDPQDERCVSYGPDMREDSPAWCDFVNWLDQEKDNMHQKCHQGIIVNYDGLKINGIINRKFLRTRNFARHRRQQYIYCRNPENDQISIWKKRLYYMIEHTHLSG